MNKQQQEYIRKQNKLRTQPGKPVAREEEKPAPAAEAETTESSAGKKPAGKSKE